MQMIKIAFSFEYIYFLKGIYLLFYFLFQLILSGYALLYIPIYQRCFLLVSKVFRNLIKLTVQISHHVCFAQCLQFLKENKHLAVRFCCSVIEKRLQRTNYSGLKWVGGLIFLLCCHLSKLCPMFNNLSGTAYSALIMKQKLNFQ